MMAGEGTIRTRTRGKYRPKRGEKMRALTLALTLVAVLGLYDKSDDVIQLTEAEFNKAVALEG